MSLLLDLLKLSNDLSVLLTITSDPKLDLPCNPLMGGDRESKVDSKYV